MSFFKLTQPNNEIALRRAFPYAMGMKKNAYVIIAHGSRDNQATRDFFEFVERFKKAVSGEVVEGAFLEITKPTIRQAIEKCASEGCKDIMILPLMFFSGRHVKEDIPKIIEEAKADHPEMDFHYASPVAEHPLMIDLLLDKIKKRKS